MLKSILILDLHGSIYRLDAVEVSCGRGNENLYSASDADEYNKIKSAPEFGYRNLPSGVMLPLSTPALYPLMPRTLF
jgi:hypothetical protein